MIAVATREATLAEAGSPEPEAAERLFEPGGETLEDRILGAWDELVAGGSTACPVCGARMSAAGGCAGCGSELS